MDQQADLLLNPRYTAWSAFRMQWRTWAKSIPVTSSLFGSFTRLHRKLQLWRITIKPKWPRQSRFNLGQTPTKYFRQGFPENQRLEPKCKVSKFCKVLCRVCFSSSPSNQSPPGHLPCLVSVPPHVVFSEAKRRCKKLGWSLQTSAIFPHTVQNPVKESAEAFRI